MRQSFADLDVRRCVMNVCHDDDYDELRCWLERRLLLLSLCPYVRPVHTDRILQRCWHYEPLEVIVTVYDL